MLAADVPYLEVERWVWRWEGDGSNVLADGGNGLEVGVRGRVGAFYLLEERRLAGIVEA